MDQLRFAKVYLFVIIIDPIVPSIIPVFIIPVIVISFHHFEVEFGFYFILLVNLFARYVLAINLKKLKPPLGVLGFWGFGVLEEFVKK